MNRMPHLEEINGKKVIFVDGKPMILFAGEVHNSNSSSLKYMEEVVWPKAEELGMNCLLLPVTWELVEPEEGSFDDTLIDGLIWQAREHRMKIVFLWFGAWKNAECMYAPEWVKRDTDRFRRAELVKGQKQCRSNFGGLYTTLSAFCEETKRADARAFRHVCERIASIDSTMHTVVAVQVENETGFLTAGREHSDEADRLFTAEVPAEFAGAVRERVDEFPEEIAAQIRAGADTGDWAAQFGEAAEEIFSAWAVSSYVEYVAAAGYEELPVPMAANSWLDKGDKPGTYPTGGPVAKMHPVWRICAPHIGILEPDIYVQNFLEICDDFTKNGNPLFIPETATHSHAAPRALYCVGHYHCACFSPFGFEDMGEPFGVMQGFLFGMDVNDPLLQTPQDVEEYGWVNCTMRSMMPMLLNAYGTNRLQAFITERPEENTMIFGCHGFRIITDERIIRRKDGVCLVLQEDEDTFYLIAYGCMPMTFSADPAKPCHEIALLEEGSFEHGIWVPGRRLNGDESAFMSYEKPTLLKIRLHEFA